MKPKKKSPSQPKPIQSEKSGSAPDPRVKLKKMTTMNVSLPESLRNFTEQRVAMGYSSASEYIRELIREDRKRVAQDRLEELILDGIDSGFPVEMTNEYWEKKKKLLEQREDKKA